MELSGEFLAGAAKLLTLRAKLKIAYGEFTVKDFFAWSKVQGAWRRNVQAQVPTPAL